MAPVSYTHLFPDLKTFNYRFRDLFHMYPSEYRLVAEGVVPRKPNQRRYCEEDNELVVGKMGELSLIHI